MSTEQAIALTKNGTRSKRVQATIFEPHLAELKLDQSLAFLKPLLEERQRYFSPGGPGGYSEQERVVQMYDVDCDRGLLRFPAGLLPRVERALGEHGYRLQVLDWRRKSERWDPEVLTCADSDEWDLLEACDDQPLGQIEVASA